MTSKEIWAHIAVFPAIILAGLSPLLIAMLIGFITSLFGKILGIAPNNPVIEERFYYAMVVAMLFSIVTVPLAAISFIGYSFYFAFKVIQILMEELDAWLENKKNERITKPGAEADAVNHAPY